MIFLLNKAFSIIEEKLSETLSSKGFTAKKNNDLTTTFSDNNVNYKLEYNENSKKFILSFAGENSDNYKSISVWLFDPESDTEKEAKSIANDFSDYFNGSKNDLKIKKSSKKSDEDSTAGLMFMVNRFATIFPEVKEDIKLEKNSFESFRAINFTKEKILPLILSLVETGKPGDKYKKLCSTLNNLYDNGNLDTRACITIVILNSVCDCSEKTIEKLQKNLSEDLNHAWKAAKKYKGKKVKPEKRKTKKSFFEKALENTQSQQLHN